MSVTTIGRERRARQSVVTHAGLGRFLRTAANHRVLDPQEEADLAKRVAAGRAAEELLETARHEPDVRSQLHVVARAGRQAADELFHHNIRLVVDIARRFSSVAATEEYTFEDRIQEGILGLIRAVEKFDPTKGFKFSTYATWWVRQFMDRGATSTGAVRLPVHVWDELRKLWTARNRIVGLGGVLNERSLCQVSGLDRSTVKRLLKAEPLLLVRQLDGPLGPDGGTVAELVATIEPGPSDRALDADVKRRVRERLSELDARSRIVLERRFGLEDDREWTLEEIGIELGLTRERIRQVQVKALEKLSHDRLLAELL